MTRSIGLQATALHIKNAFLNQPVEVLALPPQLASYLGIGDRRPDLVVCFGYGTETPRSLVLLFSVFRK